MFISMNDTHQSNQSVNYYKYVLLLPQLSSVIFDVDFFSSVNRTGTKITLYMVRNMNDNHLKKNLNNPLSQLQQGDNRVIKYSRNDIRLNNRHAYVDISNRL